MLDKRTVAYIQDCMQKGYTVDSIKEVLIKNGYSINQINSYFDSLNTTSNVYSKKDNERDVVSYIKDLLSRGYDKDQIKISLRNNNYSDKLIDNCFSQINLKKNNKKILGKKVFLVLGISVFIVILVFSGFFIFKSDYVNDLFDNFKGSSTSLETTKEDADLKTNSDILEDNLKEDKIEKKEKKDIMSKEDDGISYISNDESLKFEEAEFVNESSNLSQHNVTIDKEVVNNTNTTNTSNVSLVPSFGGGGSGSSGGGSSNSGGQTPDPDVDLPDEGFIELKEKFIFPNDEDDFIRIIFDTNLTDCELKYSDNHVKDVSSNDVIELLNNRENLNLWNVCCGNKCV